MASTQVETVSTGADKARLVVAGLLVIGALAAFYLLSGQGAVAQWGGLVAGLALAVITFFTSESGKRLIAFGRDSWREVQKVVWPLAVTVGPAGVGFTVTAIRLEVSETQFPSSTTTE